MPMNGNRLGNEIFDVIVHPNATPEAQTAVKELWQKIGNAIVRHIQNNAEVLSGISVSTDVTTAVSTNPATGIGSGSGSGTGSTTEVGKIQ